MRVALARSSILRPSDETRHLPAGSPVGMSDGEMRIIPVVGMPEVSPGSKLAEMIFAHARLEDGDVVVVTQKIVSKAEGRLVKFESSDEAAERRRLIAAESSIVLRRRGDLQIVQTRHGFVCANAGIDLSNVPAGYALLLPVDADRSARRLRRRLAVLCGVDVAVVISDTFGRPWRRGVVDVAIGCAGVGAIEDLRGKADSTGRTLQGTEICTVDEVAAAAELVMGKTSGVPVAIVRGLARELFRESSVAAEVVRPAREDLFR
jgi:coenzyme F420-0:L-glutamate ligase/coenzyme F420-1:gamma-L-glutamate ligase